jgi:hypothetical protein
MKIQIVKKGSGKMRGSEPCPWLVEYPPEASK